MYTSQAGTVDLLNCYYAHSEENQLFQRRSYWCDAPYLLTALALHPSARSPST